MAVNALTYVRNVGRSFGYSAIDTLKEYNPAIAEMGKQAKDLSSDLYHSIKDFKENSSVEQDTNSFVGQAKDSIKEIWASFKEDVKSGNFYNKQRMKANEDAMMSEMFGDLDFDFDDDFGDFNFDDDENAEIEERSADANAKSEMASAKAIVGGVDTIAAKTVGAMSDVTIKSADYVASTQERSSKALYHLNEKGFGAITQGLGSISASMNVMQSLAEPLTSHMQNAATFYSRSTEYQDKVLNILEDIKKNTVAEDENKVFSSRKKSVEDLMSGGVLDLGGYLDFIKSNVKEYTDIATGFLDMFGGLKGASKMISGSPLHFLTNLMVSKALPKGMKKSMKDFNSYLGDATYSFLGSLKDRDMGNGVLNILKDLMAPDTSYKDYISVNKFKKGKMPWDGVAKHALTQIIPQQLSKIVSALTGEDRTLFDYRTGRWRKYKYVPGEVKQKIKNNITSNDLNYTIKNTLNKQQENNKISKEHRQKLEDEIEEFMYKAGTTNSNDFMKFMKDDFNYSSYGLSKEAWNVIRNVIKVNSVNKNKDLKTKFVADIFRSRQYNNDYKKQLEQEGGIELSLTNGDYDEEAQKRDNAGGPGRSFLLDVRDEKKHNIFFYLQGIYQFTRHLSDNVGNMGGGAGGLNINGTITGNTNPGFVPLKDIEDEKTEEVVNTVNNVREKKDIVVTFGGRFGIKSDKDKKMQEYATKRAEFLKNHTIDEWKKSDMFNSKFEDIYIKAYNKALKKSVKSSFDNNQTVRYGNALDGIQDAAKDVMDSDKKYREEFSSKELNIYANNKKQFVANHGGSDAAWKGSAEYDEDLERKLERELSMKRKLANQFKDLKEDKKLNPVIKAVTGFFDKINNVLATPAKYVEGFYDSLSTSINNALFGEDKKGGIVDWIKALAEDFAGTSRLIAEVLRRRVGEKIGNKLLGTSVEETYIDENGEEKTRKRREGGILSNFLNKSTDTLKDVGAHLKGKLGFAEGGVVDESGYTTVHEGEYILAGAGSKRKKRKKNKKAKITQTGIAEVAKGDVVVPTDNPDKDKEAKEEAEAAEQGIVAKAVKGFGNLRNKASNIAKEAQGNLDKKSKKYLKNKYKFESGQLTNEQIADLNMIENGRDFAKASVNKLFDGFRVISDMLFGKDPEKDVKKAKKEADEKTKKVLEGLNQGQGGIGAGAILGGGLSILTGGIINPIFGAALGAGVGLIKQSETIQKLLFGEEGNQTDLQKKMQDFILDKVPSIAEGAGFGGAAGMFMGSPVIGAILGGTVGFVASSTGAKDYLFGKGDDDGLITKETQKRVKAALPNIGAGALAGLVAGPFGLAGNIIMGSAIGYATSTDKFKNWLFGEEAEEDYIDENGKTQKRKVRKGGLVESLKSGLTNPILDVFTGIGTMIKHDLGKIFSNMGKMVKNILSGFKKTFEQSFLGRLLKSKVGNAIGGLVKKIGGGILGAPGRALGHMKESLDKRALRQGYEIWDNKLKRNLTSEERLAKADKLGYTNTLAYKNSTGHKISEALVGKSKEELEDLQRSLDNYTKGRDFESYKLDKTRAQLRLKGLAGVNVDDQDVIDEALKKIDKLNKASRKVNSEKERKANQIEMNIARKELMEKLKGMEGFKNEKSVDEMLDKYITASDKYNQRDLEQKKIAEAFGIDQKKLKDFAAKDALTQVKADLNPNAVIVKEEEKAKNDEKEKTKSITQIIPEALHKIIDLLSINKKSEEDADTSDSTVVDKSVEETSVISEETKAKIEANNLEAKKRNALRMFNEDKLSPEKIRKYVDLGYLDKSVLDVSVNGKITENTRAKIEANNLEAKKRNALRLFNEGKLSPEKIRKYVDLGYITLDDVRDTNTEEETDETMTGHLGHAASIIKEKAKTGFNNVKESLSDAKDKIGGTFNKIKNKLSSNEPKEGDTKEVGGNLCIYHNGEWIDKKEYEKDKKFKDSIIGIPTLIGSVFGKDGIFGKLFGPKEEEDEEKESIFDKIFKKLFGDGDDEGILGGIKTFLTGGGLKGLFTDLAIGALGIGLLTGAFDPLINKLASAFPFLKGNDEKGPLSDETIEIGGKEVQTDGKGNAYVDENGYYHTLDGNYMDGAGNIIDPNTNQIIDKVDVNQEKRLGENNSAHNLIMKNAAVQATRTLANGGTVAQAVNSGVAGKIVSGMANTRTGKVLTGLVGKAVKAIQGAIKFIKEALTNRIVTKAVSSSDLTSASNLLDDVGSGLAKECEKVGEYSCKAVEGGANGINATAAKTGLKEAAKLAYIAQIAAAFVNGYGNAPTYLGVVESMYDMPTWKKLLAGAINAINYAIPFIGGLIPTKVFYNVFFAAAKHIFGDSDWLKTWEEKRNEAEAELKAFNDANGKHYGIAEYNQYMHNCGVLTDIGGELGEDVRTIGNTFKNEGVGETLANIGKGFVETVKDEGLFNTLIANPLKENTVGNTLSARLDNAVEHGVANGNKLAIGYDKFMTGVGDTINKAQPFLDINNWKEGYNRAMHGMAEKVVNFGDKLGINEKLNNAGEWASEKWNNVKEGASDIYHWAGEKASEVGNWASEKWSNVKEGAADIYNWAAEGITNKFNEFKQGIVDGIVALKDKLGNSKLVDIGRQYLEVHKILSDGWKGGSESLVAARRSITDNVGKGDDLFSPFQAVLADIDTVLASPLAGAVDLGKNVSAKFTEIKESVFNTLVDTGKLTLKMWDYAKEGNVVGVGNVGRNGNDGDVTKLMSAMIEIPRIFCSFMAAAVETGNYVSGKFSELKEKVSGTFNTIGNAHNELWSAALQGDLATFNNAGKVDENGNPLYGLASGVIDLDRTISTGIALTVSVGKSVKQKFDEIKTKASTTFSNIGNAHNEIWTAAFLGDMSGIENVGKVDEEGNPLGGITSAILDLPRFLAFGTGLIINLGKAVNNKIAETKGKVVNTINNIKPIHDNIWAKALDGDMEGMLQEGFEDEEGNPISGIASAASYGIKFIAFTPALIVSTGKHIKNKIDELKEKLFSDFSNMDSMNEKYKELANNGDFAGVWNTKAEVEDQPLGVIFTIGNFINKIFYTMVAFFNKITGNITEKIENVKETASNIAEGAADIWNGAKDWGSDVVNGAKEFASNTWNDATSFVNDTFGWGSGIKTRKPAGKGGFVSQTDPRYANMSIGGESIEDAGCAPAVASMTASQYGKSLDMKDAVGIANNYQNTNGTTLDYFGDAMSNVGVGTRGLNNTTQVYNDLSAGNPVIMLGQDGGNGSKSRSPFGPSNHYVVATGLDNNGNVIVNDPEANAPRTYSPSIMKNVKAAIGTNSLAGGSSRLRRSAYKPARTRIGGRGPSDRFPQQIFQFLKENGYTELQAAAIMGCWQNESGLKHMTIECYYSKSFPGYDNLVTPQQLSYYTQNVVWPYWRANGINPTTSAYYNDSDGGYYPGMGLAQWTGPRAYNLINFATSNNLPWYDLKAQLNFFLYETTNGGPRSGAANSLKQCNNLEDAVEIFGKGYEGAYKKGSSNYNKALSYAKTLYQECSGRPASDITALTSNINNNISNSGSSGSTVTTSPIDYMKSILGTIDYSMSGPRNPDKGSADCSSTVRWAIMKAGGPDIGGNTAVQYENPNLTPVWYQNGATKASGVIPEGLQPNDVLFFKRDGSYTAGRKDRVGHVGLYLGNGQYIDHGSGVGPKIKNLANDHTLIKASRLNGASFNNTYTAMGASNYGSGVAGASLANGTSDNGTSGGSILSTIIGWFTKIFGGIFNGGIIPGSNNSTATTGGYDSSMGGYYDSSYSGDYSSYGGDYSSSSSSTSSLDQKTNYNSDGYTWDRSKAIMLPNNGKGPNGSYEAQQWAALQKDPDAYVKQIAEWNKRDISKVPPMNATARSQMLKASNGLDAYVDYFMSRSAPLGVTRGIFDLTNAKKWNWDRSKALTVPRINSPQDQKNWEAIKNDPDKLAKYIAELNGRDISHVAAMNYTAKNELLKSQGGKDAYVDYMMQHSLPLETTWRKWIKGTGANEVERGAKAAGSWSSYLNQNLAGYGSNHKPAGKGAGEYYNDQVAAQRADSLNKAATEAKVEKNNITVRETNNINPTMDKTTAVMLKAIITLVESLVANTSKVDGIYELLAQLVTQSGKGNEATIAAIGQLASSNANKGIDAGLQALKEAVDSIIAS